MRDRNRRLICRWLFMLLGFLPTCGVVGYVVAIHLPFVLAAERQSWIQRIHCSNSMNLLIGQVSWPTWGVARLVNVRAQDSETDSLLASIDSVEIQESRDSIDVTIDSMEITEGRLIDALTELHDCLLRRRSNDNRQLRVAITSLMIESGQQPFHIHHLNADARTSADNPQIQVHLEISDNVHSECTFLVRRNRDFDPPLSQIELTTGEAGIPAALLYELNPDLALLGANCRFQGFLLVRQTKGGISGEIEGNLQQIDLQTVTERLPSKLSGRAEIRDCVCRILDGKVVRSRGQLIGYGGTVSHSLLVALTECLRLRLPAEVASSTRDPIAYRKLSTQWNLTEEALFVRGTCDNQEGIFVDADQTVLLASRRGSAVKPLELVRALVPQSEHQVPATKQTAGLFQYFPVPDVTPPKTNRWSSAPRIQLQRAVN